jgi:hypothetical protein
VVPGQVQKAAQYIGNMKNLLPLLFLGLSLASCSKGGDDPKPAPVVTSPYSQLLLGRWNKVSAEATISQVVGPPITTLVNFPAGAEYDVFTTATVESFISSVSQRISRYTLSGSAYTITKNGFTDTYNIKDITATRLVTSLSYPTSTKAGPGTAVVIYTYTR